MRNIMPHERLIVYEKALSFVRTMAPEVEMWPAIHAVRDQMDRACESLMVNLVKAAWQQRTSQGVYHLECSLGSALECAACLDVAYAKALLDNKAADSAKRALAKALLHEIMAMLEGLKGYLAGGKG